MMSYSGFWGLKVKGGIYEGTFGSWLRLAAMLLIALFHKGFGFILS